MNKKKLQLLAYKVVISRVSWRTGKEVIDFLIVYAFSQQDAIASVKRDGYVLAPNRKIELLEPDIYPCNIEWLVLKPDERERPDDPP